MTKFQNKYRIESARAQWWDYSNAGAYFITICTQDRKHYFGKIMNDQMEYTEIGKIVESEWIKTPSIRPDMNLELDAFVVMPNHFHGIIFIGDNDYNTVETRCIASLQLQQNQQRLQPQRKTLGSIVRGFKSPVTLYARKNNIEFDWQTRYHDRIVRNEEECNRIRKYIQENPFNWHKDDFFEDL